ncbi:MAG TPA: sugar ABC transporter permease [Acidimicrobiales bacterium]|nr:sugar ABC transporter permease [Acidimicrobiales bacterium]
MRLEQQARRRSMGPAFLAVPYMFGLVALVGVPLVGTAVLAFTDYSGISAPQWVGAANLRAISNDDSLGRAVLTTVVVVAVAVPLRVAGATALALLLHRPGRSVTAARAAAFLPTVVPDVALALVWAWLLNPLSGPLALAGLPIGGVLTDPVGARLAVAVLVAFQLGEGFVIALAWRTSLGRTPYEAATLAGASPGFVLRRLTLPQMRPALAALAVRDAVVVLHATFVAALLLTRGGPSRATVGLPQWLYETEFAYLRVGYASAASLTVLVVTGALTAAAWWSVRRNLPGGAASS